MNNEIWFVLDGKKIVLDSDPFEKHNGYFYLPGGAIGHANNMAELLAGKIEVKREFDCPRSRHVPAFTVKMQNFDVEFDNGIPVRFWLEKKNNQSKKNFNEEDLKRFQRAAQKLCDNCKFGRITTHNDERTFNTSSINHGMRVNSFAASKETPNVFVAECTDLLKEWENSPR